LTSGRSERRNRGFEGGRRSFPSGPCAAARTRAEGRG
jgi:hypothetical protein